jgi:hypothetical protein
MFDDIKRIKVSVNSPNAKVWTIRNSNKR